MKKDKSIYDERHGFTLVEMLIVIAVIGILTGMLVPSLSRAKENARRAECVSNLHQLQAAATSYASDESTGSHFPYPADREYYNIVGETWYTNSSAGWVSWVEWKDHDEGNPDGYGDNPPDELRTYWWGDKGEDSIRNGSLFPYIEDVRVYICPSFTRYVKENGDSRFEDAKRSYVMAANLTYNTFVGLASSGMSRRMMFADGAYEAKSYKDKDGHNVTATWGLKDEGAQNVTRKWTDGHGRIHQDIQHCYFRGNDGMLEFEYDTEKKQIELIGDYHHGKGNVVFIDGHTECLSPALTEDIYSGDYEPGQR